MTHHGVLSLFAPGGEGGASHGEWAFWAIRHQRGVKSRDNYELQGWRLHETCIPPGTYFCEGAGLVSVLVARLALSATWCPPTRNGGARRKAQQRQRRA